MADSRIIDLTSLTAAAGDQIPVVRAGADGRVSAQSIANLASVTANFVNIVTDYGATGDGTTDDRGAFEDFTNAYQDDEVILYMPPGEYTLTAGDQNDIIFRGIKKLRVYGYGASFTQKTGNNDDTLRFGPLHTTYGYDANSTDHGAMGGVQVNIRGAALIATVNGASSSSPTMTITLLTEADNTKFVVGDWVMIASSCLQHFGFPQNLHIFEYHQIASVSGTTITLETPIKYRHSSTLPNFAPSATEVYGGAATAFLLDPQWDCEHEICGVTFNGARAEQLYYNGKLIKFTECTFDYTTPTPAGNATYILDRCKVINSGNHIEVDKCVDTIMIRDCPEAGEWNVQSASVNNYILENSGFIKVSGTGKNCLIKGCAISYLSIGCNGYGPTWNLLIEDSQVAAVHQVTDGSNYVIGDNFTYANGDLTGPTSNGAPAGGFLTPGTRCVWSGLGSGSAYNWFPPEFIVLDSYVSGSDIIVETTLDSTFDYTTQVGTGDSNNDTAVRMLPHPAPNVTVRNSTGCVWITSLNSAPDGAPLYTYAKRLLVGGFNSGTAEPGQNGALQVRGYLVEVRINVIRAYTGTGALTLAMAFSSSDSTDTSPSNFAGGFTNVTWTIDLKTVGERTVAPGAVTKEASDTIATPSAGVWITRDIGLSYSADIRSEDTSEWPIVEIEANTNFGLINLGSMVIGESSIQPYK
jgi:hypothetical protein